MLLATLIALVLITAIGVLAACTRTAPLTKHDHILLAMVPFVLAIGLLWLHLSAPHQMTPTEFQRIVEQAVARARQP